MRPCLVDASESKLLRASDADLILSSPFRFLSSSCLQCIIACERTLLLTSSPLNCEGSVATKNCSCGGPSRFVLRLLALLALTWSVVSDGGASPVND
jgi:hypothetical protein